MLSLLLLPLALSVYLASRSLTAFVEAQGQTAGVVRQAVA